LQTAFLPARYDRDAIRGFAASVRARLELITQVSDEESPICAASGAIDSEGAFVPNVAVYLLFAKEPDRVIPGCKIRFLRFDGEQEGTGEKFNAVKDILIEGLTVPKMIHKADRCLTRTSGHLHRLRKTKRFHASLSIQKAAWYEAVVNACAHRSYGRSAEHDHLCQDFDDRLEVRKPRSFPAIRYATQHLRNVQTRAILR